MGLEDERNITVPRFQLPGPALILLGPALGFEIYKHPKILRVVVMKGIYSTVHFVDSIL